MIIRDILRAKRDRVETIWPERTLAEALARFEERSISSVVVIDHSSRPIGIVTDRDVLRAIARRGPSVLQLPTTDVMQSPAPACRPEDTVTDIMHRMTNERIRHVVVIDDRRLVGIVSIGDLIKSRLRDADLETRVLRERVMSHLAAE